MREQDPINRNQRRASASWFDIFLFEEIFWLIGAAARVIGLAVRGAWSALT